MKRYGRFYQDKSHENINVLHVNVENTHERVGVARCRVAKTDAGLADPAIPMGTAPMCLAKNVRMPNNNITAKTRDQP